MQFLGINLNGCAQIRCQLHCALFACGKIRFRRRTRQAANERRHVHPMTSDTYVSRYAHYYE